MEFDVLLLLDFVSSHAFLDGGLELGEQLEDSFHLVLVEVGGELEG